MSANKKPRKKVSGCMRERMLKKMHSRIQAKNQRAREDVAKENAEIERLNNLPLGHPDHGDRLMITFTPILKWMSEVERTGDSDRTLDGRPILFAPDHPTEDKYFQLDDALIAVADCYSLIANRRGIADEGSGVRQLGKKLQADMLLFQSDMDLARKSIDWMIEQTKSLSPVQIQEYTSIISVRALMAQSKASAGSEASP